MATESSGNAKWDSVLTNYTKLSRAMRRSKEQEVDLLATCRDLKAALVEKALQLSIAQATKIEDDLTISELRTEMERANKR